MDANIDNADNGNESAPNPIECEIIESWTFLGDESTNPINHPGSGVENITEHPDDDTKIPSKSSRSSSSCVSDNFLSVTYHGTDGDLSDGISVISDCDSINDRHSPMPPKMATPELRIDYADDEETRSDVSGIAAVQSYSLVERSTDNEVQVLDSSTDSDQQSVWWNPSNILLFGLIIGVAAILSSQCWKVNLSHGNVIPDMSLLTQRIQDLERENVALKVEVNRLVELHHAGHEHSPTHENNVAETRPVKQKKVWTGADDAAIHIPKEPVKENYCREEYLNSDDLFASYNFKKCENIDDAKKQGIDKVKSKQGWDAPKMTSQNRSRQTDTRRNKNFDKDDSATNKRQKFAENKFNAAVESQGPAVDTNENVRNEKFVKIQTERQKLFDEATQKYLNLQKKTQKKQEKDRKNRDNVLKESENMRKQSKDMDSEWYDKMMKKREELRAKSNEDTDSEWYGKMMKQREELRATGNNSGGTKQKNKENWYTERANEREKVRGKREKQTKLKQPR
ncbi:uncharacterized protein LOC119077600 [Bradysia coprophila]|uniref:uncharacterized protein LOC119077600 n=1 Tax=Bradysia coprophila TaxID=38358 RepID=UPI00187DB4DD|nr:uncharacterized protein LOC119077600 [Bradysia coprophila]XP_037040702.1 uncharacterized protein LOC119077600 [Bradysia coprophila]XP_037040703.1 uncharacterized protein LOC119077600 [Bradysia coprophila]XP_037040705.1 uncharacterized protein LOC119077600 [Bradysia coprophila]XP_037040706.1 uncharacterized protein LOC119077600 [Bradysia coprophila]XP_037040707.1 uncharacterized protein LOC119077600 [Bradysia coprophila]XP_037040708.1 uncharacterized protein LOC119077600 [Bradysia coprophil